MSTVGKYFSVNTKFYTDSEDVSEDGLKWSFEAIVDLWMQKIQPVAAGIVAKLAPVGQNFDLSGTPHPTYTFRNSLYPVQYHTEGSGHLDFLSRAPYAGFLIDGTKPHTIQAVNSRFLAFWWGKMGGAAFFPQVQHPGTKPSKFPQEAKQAILPQAKKLMISTLEEYYK